MKGKTQKIISDRNGDCFGACISFLRFRISWSRNGSGALENVQSVGAIPSSGSNPSFIVCN